MALTPQTQRDEKFFTSLARAFGGAIIFGLPLLMTMEMWWLGFHMDRFHLVILLLVNFPFLVGLSHYSGFEKTSGLTDDILSAFVAYGIGIGTATVIFTLLAIVTPEMSPSEIIGKIGLQAIPGSIGAVLARTMLGTHSFQEKREKRINYMGELFVMQVGAIFVGFNLAPTEEMLVISYQMSPVHAIALMLLSIVMIHTFTYSIEFKGQASPGEGIALWKIFLRFTVVGYAIALAMSLFVLWAFGRTEGTGLNAIIMMTVVLGFPSALGAAAARLIL